MANQVRVAYVLFDLLFMFTGALMAGFCMVAKNIQYNDPADGVEAARLLLYQRFPLKAGIVNGLMIFVTFLITMPGIITPARVWIRTAGVLTAICGLFSLVIGLFLWIDTLQTKEQFAPLFAKQTEHVKDLMQESFQCCGFFNSTSPAFVTDSTCPSPASAALMRGCAAPIASYANIFVNDIFTAVFGMVGIDALFILAAACLLKERTERERFRHIDEKCSAI